MSVLMGLGFIIEPKPYGSGCLWACQVSRHQHDLKLETCFAVMSPGPWCAEYTQRKDRGHVSTGCKVKVRLEQDCPTVLTWLWWVY